MCDVAVVLVSRTLTLALTTPLETSRPRKTRMFSTIFYQLLHFYLLRLQFLLSFFAIYEQFANNEFWITGEVCILGIRRCACVILSLHSLMEVIMCRGWLELCWSGTP